jgi:hypothetical protein
MKAAGLPLVLFHLLKKIFYGDLTPELAIHGH